MIETTAIALAAFLQAMPYLLRLGMKLFKVDVPGDVYGFEDIDYV